MSILSATESLNCGYSVPQASLLALAVSIFFIFFGMLV